MYFVKALAALSVAASAYAQTFSINTPASLVQCQPASVSWVGGTGPYILATIPGGETGAAAISTLSSDLTSSPYTWNVNLASGTYITLKLTDSTGNIAYSSPLTIQAGSSSSCLDASASTSGIATTGAVTTTGSGSATLSGTTANSTSATSAAAVTTSSASASAATTSRAASSAAATTAASSAAASSASAAATSAAASAAPSSGAFPAAIVGVPAVALALGGLTLLL